MTTGRLSGKVALVTGAGRGIGRAIALRLATEGATIVAHYANSQEGAQDVIDTIRRGGGNALALRADIGQRQEVIRLFEDIDRGLGRLDITVNSAGISSATPLANLDETIMEALLAVNLR